MGNPDAHTNSRGPATSGVIRHVSRNDANAWPCDARLKLSAEEMMDMTATPPARPRKTRLNGLAANLATSPSPMPAIPARLPYTNR